jgi:hypothetical protein
VLRLGFYIGMLQKEPVYAEDSREAWVERMFGLIYPVLQIEPKPLLNFDSVYGQWSGHPDQFADAEKWEFLGGNDGAIALLYQTLAERGYELSTEPFTLADPESAWTLQYGTYITEWTRRACEERDPPWSTGPASNRKLLVPETLRKGRRLIEIKPDADDTRQERQARVDAVLTEGHDCVVSISRLPMSGRGE